MAASPKVNFSGTWELVSTDGMDDFIAKVDGVLTADERARLDAMKMKCTIVHDPDASTWKVEIKLTAAPGLTVECKLDGTPYEYTNARKLKVKATMKVSEDGTKLLGTRAPEGKEPRVVTRYMEGDEMLVKVDVATKDASMTRHFKKIA